jgi:DNA replication protein DnaD
MKECNKCGEMKADTEFHRDKAMKDGLKNSCIKCTSETMKEYHKAHYKQNRMLTIKQHKILQFIDDIYKQYGKYPTYNELAEKTGTTKQDIAQCIDFLIKKYEVQKEAIDKFISLEKSINTGWIALRIKLKDGIIIKQSVTAREVRA